MCFYESALNITHFHPVFVRFKVVGPPWDSGLRDGVQQLLCLTDPQPRQAEEDGMLLADIYRNGCGHNAYMDQSMYLLAWMHTPCYTKILQIYT